MPTPLQRLPRPVFSLSLACSALLMTACGPDAGTAPEATTAAPAEPTVQVAPAAATALAYPDTATVEQVDNYHGTDVADPYRWLEDDVRVNDDVASWVEAQNAVTYDYLGAIEEREAIEERLTALWNYEKFGVPGKAGSHYFFSRNDGLQNQNVIYRQSSLDAEPELVVDPNTWSDDGTVALAGFEVSPDGRFAALAVQDGGSDWRTVRILNLETGELSGDEVSWMKFSPMSWDADSSGFYYSRYPAPAEGDEFQTLNHDQQVFFHQVGTAQETDRPVYARPDHPDWGFSPVVTDDGDYLVITIWKGTDSRYQVAYQRLNDPQQDAEPVMLIEGFDHDYTFVGNIGSRFFFRTDRDAPRGRLVSIDVESRDTGWTEVIPERDAVLRGVSHVGGQFVASYLRDARSEIRIHDPDGTLAREVALPGIGSVQGFGGEADDPETFYRFSSFNAPPTLYHYDVNTGESTLFKQAAVDFEPADYIVKQVFYDSKDGTRVPLFIAHKKGIELNGDNPTLLYGYGGFNIPLTPSFSITRLAWMEMGGVYAVANLRGGGEYGKEWHQAGTKLNKQNVFDDFIAAGEYLVAERYTRPERLAVLGGSNGGLLVGAVVNQRPDLFGAAIPAVGVMDMLRFDQFTAGRFWVDDYGSSSNPEEFEALYAYSPYHNLEDGTEYPAVLVTTADTDDRVVPGHSFKYAARLQAAQGGTDPVLIRIQTRAGHGSGKPTAVQIEETADMWAFLAENLDLQLPEGYGD
jgi:prolyl oligopeptidase